MMSFRALLAAAPLLALAVAQNIALTSTPSEAVAGESYNITWGGGDGTGVTLTLRRGNPQDLHTVSTIADAVTDSYYVWTVPDDLESGDDYAFQITQGQSDINYSGLFSVDGADDSASTSSSAAAASSTLFSNGTASITSMSGALVTGTAAVRNSTFSSATLTSTSSSTTSHNFNDLSSTSTHSSATRTPSSSSTSAPSNDASTRAGSSAALILGIVAAVMLH